MGFDYNPNYFIDAQPSIYENEYLREPQKQGYYHVYEHFIIKEKHLTQLWFSLLA